MPTIAVMQPYFFPYTGYYRLFAAADIFVIFDCVQFPRRGYVHRNRLPDGNGRLTWLTLPLAHALVDTPINRLDFAADAAAQWNRRLGRVPSLQVCTQPEFATLWPLVAHLADDPAAYLERTLSATAAGLGLTANIMRSSQFGLPPDVRGSDRVVEICRRLGATSYVNAPGGRTLYDPAHFARYGIDLSFLAPWTGPAESMLHRLATEPWSRLADEVRTPVVVAA